MKTRLNGMMAREFGSLLLVALLTLLWGGIASAQTRMVGINDHIIWRTNAEQDVAFTKYADSGTKFIRTGADWNVMETSKGVYHPTYLARLDYFFTKCTAAGIRVLLIPAYAPSWANGGNAGSGYAPLPAKIQDYADFCEFLLTRYTAAAYINSAGQHTLEAMEIWNEPDLADIFFKPYARYSATGATAYGNMVVAAGGRLKSIRSSLGASDVLICAPVVSEVRSVCWAPAGQTTWMDAFYAVSGVTANYDVFSWHSYWQSAGSTSWLPPELPPCFSTTNQLGSVMGKLTASGASQIWAKMTAQGDNLKPNWLTEIGGAARSTTPNHNPGRLLSFAEQQTHLADAIAVLGAGSVTKLDRLYWYDLFDDTSAAGDQQVYGLVALNTTNPIVYSGGVSLVGATLTPKAAYTVYKNAVKGPVNTHTGSWAGKAVLSGTASWAGMYQIPTVAPNTNYTFTFWMRGTGKMRLKISPSNWSSILAYQDFTATPTWTQYAVPGFNTGANTGLVYCFQDSGNVAGTVFLDDCFMGPAGGANKLANAGFESGNTSWTPGANFSIVQNP